MPRSPFRLSPLLAAIALLPVAQAQEAAPSTLPEVRVKSSADTETATGPALGYSAKRSATGSKTDTALVETPQSVSVLTRERIEAQGADTVVDALGYTAGVTAGVYGQDSRYDWINLRGFDLYSPGFYVDGLQTRNNGSWASFRSNPYGLERIEVLRGPSSVLFGQGSPGGLLNLVSKRPTAEPQRELRLQLGSHERRELAGDVSGPLNEDGSLLYRLTALARDSGTQVDHADDDRVFLAPALSWKLSPDTQLTLLSQFERIRSAATSGFLPREGTLVAGPNGRIPVSRFVGEPGYDHFDQDQWAFGYALEHRAGATWTLRQNARVSRVDLDYRQLYGAGLDPADPERRTLQRFAFGSDETIEALTIDTQAEARFTTGALAHTLLIGLDHQRNDFDQFSVFGLAPSLDVYAPVYGQPVADGAPFANARTRLEQTGLYVQDQARLGERWVFVLGGRHDRARSRSHDRLGDTRSRQSDSAFSGRAGVVYLMPSGVAPYLSYAESFSPSVGTDVDTGRAFEPETGRQVEAGVRWQPAGRELLLSAAVFDIRRQNYLSTEPGTFIPRQTGEVASRGVEFEAVGRVAPGLSLTAAYIWLRDFDITASADPAEVGKRGINAAEHSASLWADYRFGAGALAGWGLAAGARYTGSQYGSTGEAPESRVPGYTLFDAALSYDTPAWRLALTARNLGDKRVVATCSAAGTCFYGAARSVHATLTHRW